MLLVGVLAWAGLVLALRRPASEEWSRAAWPASARPVVVLAELFTSEGCSSCPPADDVLGQVLARQPASNVKVIGLGEHVTYWDRLGWRDRFSATVFTDRQIEYQTRVFRTTSIYTPQLVIDGRFELIGSDVSAIRNAIGQAMRSTKGSIRIEASLTGTSEVDVRIAAELGNVGARHDAEVMLGIVEDNLSTNVGWGENGGRVLKHAAVARTLDSVAVVPAEEQTVSLMKRIPLDSAWDPANLSVIAFVQERELRRILAAGATPIG
jgi:hypothetical protein